MEPAHVSLWLRQGPASKGGEGSGEPRGCPGAGRWEQALNPGWRVAAGVIRETLRESKESG